MTIQKVAVVGANGHLGPSVLAALLSANCFAVTVLSRATSRSTYPAAVHVEHISDDPTVEELALALRAQDALIVVVAGWRSALQIRLADAAVQAGVRRFIPADFGSCDSSSPLALELIPLYVAKQSVRLHLQQLAASGGSSGGGFSWTSLVCGHFFDYGLKSGLLQFDMAACKARIFDGGDVRWSATTLATVATAVVRVLQKEDETRNRMLYIQSFCVTQNEVLGVLERVTGQPWQVEHIDSESFIKEVKADTDPEHSTEQAEDLVSVVGIVDANWEGKEDFANSLLGLQAEDLGEVISGIVSS